MNLKLDTKTICKLSLIINKMGIASLILDLNVETGDEKKDNKELVKRIIMLFVENLYKAENEMNELISMLKGISIEEAKNVDITPIVKELLNNDSVKNFLNLT